MTVLVGLLVFAGEIFAIVLISLAFHNWGYQKGSKAGRDAGYDEGRKAADNWWLGVEAEADQERQKIWREETER
jgi:hypothetical protein